MTLAVALLSIGLASLVVLFAGPRMVAIADRLADVTGLGEAIVGAVLVGAATSLPDLVATVTPAVNGFPDLAVGNALGGVLAQTAFLAVIDLSYRRANLEHAAASLPNLMQAGLLITLLSTVLLLLHAPTVTIWGIHPGTIALPVIYLYGLRLVSMSEQAPMWRPRPTSETRSDEPDEQTATGPVVRSLILRFAMFGALLAAAGYALGRGGESLVAVTGLSQSMVGAFITGAASSLAELVVGVAAVRRGALTLAVGNVIGGNAFDTMLVGVADVAYRDGSVYSQVESDQTIFVGIALLMTAVLVMGLLRRQRHGIGNIGSESAIILVLYALGIGLVL